MTLLVRWSHRHDYTRALQRLLWQPRSLPIAHHARCFAAGQFTLRNQQDDSYDGGVNYFEQDFVPGADGKGYRMVGAPRNVQKKIKELEKQLAALKANNPFEDNEELELDASSLEEIDSATNLLTKHPLEVDLKLPEEQAKILRNLNSALQNAAADPTATRAARQLWQRYTVSKKEVTGLLRLLPATAWQVLWESQYDSKILNDARSQHLWILADDLVQAGQVLTPTQKLAQIEGRFIAKRTQEAISLWDGVFDDLRKHSELAEVFLSLGVKLRIQADQLDDASKLAAKLAKEQPSVAVSCFIPIIESYLASNVGENIDKAVNAYFFLRFILGDLISLEDFDRLTLCFLTNGHPDLAIGVFKDMMLAECKSPHDSVVLRQKSMNVFDSFQTSTADLADSSNEQSLKLLQFLPRQFQNKYFYASWLKRLIGLNELEAAEQVLELMAHRGVRADAKHLNGLMSAWLRRDTPHGRDIALELGKAMIQTRLDFVADRRANPNSKPRSRELPAESPLYSLEYCRKLPPATIETFSILLLHYVTSNMKSSTDHLLTTLQLAELEPNIFFANHVLLSHKQAGDAAAAWSLFNSTTRNGLRPDSDTFAILWDICKDHTEGHSPGRSQLFPSPRALFGHMTAWFAGLPAKERAEARSSMTSDTYLQVVRCLSLSRDLRGTLVALYAMRDLFGLYPDMRAARLIAMLVGRLGTPRRSQRLRLHDGTVARKRQSVKVREQASQVHFEQALHVLDLLKRERDAELAQRGVSLTALSESQRGEEVLWLLGEFLRRTLEQTGKSRHGVGDLDRDQDRTTRAATATPDSPDERLEQVAFEMGADVVQVMPPTVAVPD